MYLKVWEMENDFSSFLSIYLSIFYNNFLTVPVPARVLRERPVRAGRVRLLPQVCARRAAEVRRRLGRVRAVRGGPAVPQNMQ